MFDVYGKDIYRHDISFTPTVVTKVKPEDFIRLKSAKIDTVTMEMMECTT